MVVLDAELNSASNGDIFKGVIGQKKLICTKMRYNHDPENGNIRNSRKFRKLRRVKEIQENQGNSSNSGSQYNLKLQLFKLC
jgi:hypothetical protein